MTLQNLRRARGDEAFLAQNRSIDYRARPRHPRLPPDPRGRYPPELQDPPPRQFADSGPAPASVLLRNQLVLMGERSLLQVPPPPRHRWKRNQCIASSFRNLPAQWTLRSI